MLTVTKVCGRCQKELELNNDNFAIFKRSKDGFASMCKPCKSKYDREYRKKNKERIKERQKQYLEEHKEERSAYSKKWRDENKEYLKKYRENNKDKRRELNKKYWAENKEEQKARVGKWRKENAEYIKRYRKDNRDRDREQARKWRRTERGRKISITRTNQRRAKIKELTNDFTVEQWNECLKHFNNNCAYCGEHHDVLEQEHFIPVSKGGAFTKNNIVPSCRSCNASKLNRDFNEWYKQQNYYSIEREKNILSYLGREVKHDLLQLQ